MKAQWFRISNKADDPSVAEIQIIDWIGDWVDDAINRLYNEQIGLTARAFVEQLSALPSAVTTIKVHINSPGGDVQGGVNIANALREQGSKGRTVETYVDGIAASIASVIAMAGTKVCIGDNALMMVHNPWSIAVGNAAEMRKTADILDVIRGQIVNTYKWHSSLSDAEIVALMDAETWMSADEAIANGFATEKVEGLKTAASIDRRALGKLNVPDKFKDRVSGFMAPAPIEPKAAAAADVLRLCREGDCLEVAEALVTSGATLDQVQARITETKSAKAAASARVTQITALCATAKQPELAAGYIKGQMSADDVRAHLLTITAKQDKVEIDAGLKPGEDGRRATAIDRTAIYKNFNKR